MANDLTKPKNYEPISILPVLSEVAEDWVTMQFIEQLNGHIPLKSMEFRFCKHHSTKTDSCFLKTSSGFDIRINHDVFP